MPRFADHLEMAKEINEPDMPIIPDMINKAFKFKSTPLASSVPLKPNRLKTMLMTTIMATLVAKKRKIRNMVCLPRNKLINCLHYSGVIRIKLQYKR